MKISVGCWALHRANRWLPLHRVLQLELPEMNHDCDDNNRNDSCNIGVGAQDSDQNRRLDNCEYARGDFDLDGEITGAVLLASCFDHARIMLGSCFDHARIMGPAHGCAERVS